MTTASRLLGCDRNLTFRIRSGVCGWLIEMVPLPDKPGRDR